MIRVPRAYTRMACVILWVLILYAIRLVCMPIRILSGSLEARSRRAVFRLCSKGILAILGMRVEVRGSPPARPYLLVSNHLAAVDIFVLGSLLGPVFISQGHVAHWPLVGLIARAADTIFIDRARLKDIVRVNQLIADKLHGGEGIVFFPESTTSEDGNLLPFKTALFEAPVQAELPVHYLSLSYDAPPGRPDRPRSHRVARPRNLLRPLRADCPAPPFKSDRGLRQTTHRSRRPQSSRRETTRSRPGRPPSPRITAALGYRESNATSNASFASSDSSPALSTNSPGTS